MIELPPTYYYVTGFLIITNIGAILSIATMAFKAVWWASKIDSKVDAAHKRIDRIETK